MKTSRSLGFASCCLVMILAWQLSSGRALWGQVAAEAAPPAEKSPPLKKSLPVHESPLLKRKQLLPPGQLFEHHSLAKPSPLGLAKSSVLATPAAKVQQQPLARQAAQPLPANKRPLPTNRQQRPPFWSPPASQLPQGNLSRASVYQLGSMGKYVHLTPAMRLHLDRSSGQVSPRPSTRLPSAATVPGQGAGTYYPGVRQLPAQKPFADLERPATGLQRYWPLLLEGREDPNTGLIIWGLP